MSSPVAHVRQTLDVLRNCYANRDGQPHQLNPVQVSVYLEGLAEFSHGELEAAAREWMRTSQFFPRLPELLNLLIPKVDVDTLALMAWGKLEREIRRIGRYRGATFSDAAFGEAVRQTFGSWSAACQFDLDSPGWAIRRQTFLAVFKTLAVRSDLGAAPVTMPGLHRDRPPALIAHLEGLPQPPALTDAIADLSSDKMAEARRGYRSDE